MIKHTRVAVQTGLVLISLAGVACQPGTREAQVASLSPESMTRVGMIDERFQSYNVEMLEVTGGKFWKPYGPELDAILKQPAPAAAPSGGDTPAGMNPGLYQYLPPLDLTNTISSTPRNVIPKPTSSRRP